MGTSPLHWWEHPRKPRPCLGQGTALPCRLCCPGGTHITPFPSLSLSHRGPSAGALSHGGYGHVTFVPKVILLPAKNKELGSVGRQACGALHGGSQHYKPVTKAKDQGCSTSDLGRKNWEEPHPSSQKAGLGASRDFSIPFPPLPYDPSPTLPKHCPPHLIFRSNVWKGRNSSDMSSALRSKFRGPSA